METRTHTIGICTDEGDLEPEATFAVDLEWQPAEPDVGIMSGGWTCGATLLSWPHGKAQRSRADLVAILGEEGVAKIEDAAGQHFADEAGDSADDDDRGDWMRDSKGDRDAA